MSAKPPRPVPDGKEIRLNKRIYVVEPNGVVHVVYEQRNFMHGTPTFGKARVEFRKLQNQYGDLALAVRKLAANS